MSQHTQPSWHTIIPQSSQPRTPGPGILPWKCDDSANYKNEKLRMEQETAWGICANAVHEYDKSMCESWRDEVDKLLLFAGLFSAAVTAFTVESYKMLKPDSGDTTVDILTRMELRLNQIAANNISQVPAPPSDDFFPTHAAIRINVVWFLSLTFSLTTVLVGILCLQWLREYQRTIKLNHKDSFQLRQMRYDGLKASRVPSILASLPFMLLSALVLFFVGVIDLLFSLNRIVASLVSIVIALTLLFLIFTTLWPAIQAIRTPDPYLRDAQCAFKSPQSFVMQKILLRVFIAFLHYSIFEKLYIKTVNLKATRQTVHMQTSKAWVWAKSILLLNRRPLSDPEKAIDSEVDAGSVRSDATVQTLAGTAERSENSNVTVTPPAEKEGNNTKSAKSTKKVRLGLSKKEVLVRLQATSNWTAWDGRWQDLRHASDNPDKDVKDTKPFIDITNGLTWLGCTFIRRQDILLAATFCIRSIKNACAISTVINDSYTKTKNMYATEKEKAFYEEAALIRSDHLAVLSSLDPNKVDEAHVFNDLASALTIRFFNDQHWSNFNQLGSSRMELFIRCLNSLPNDKCLTIDNVNITTVIEGLPEDHQLQLITAILQRVKNESAQNKIDWDNASEVLKTFLRIHHRKTLRSPGVRTFVAKFNEDLLVKLEENANTDHYTLACLRFIVKLFYNDFHDKEESYPGLRITEAEFPGFFKCLTPLVWRLDKLLNESRYDCIWDEAAQIVEDINRKELLVGESGKGAGRVEHEEGWLPKLVHSKDSENLKDPEDKKKWDPLTKEKWMNFVNQFPEEPVPVEPLEEEPAAGPSESGNGLTSPEPASIVADNSATSEASSSASPRRRFAWAASQLQSRFSSNKQ